MIRLDERLDDRHLPFSDKLTIAHQQLASMATAAELEQVLEWTLSTLLKLSKAANPRPEVFLSEQLWQFMEYLLQRCFPVYSGKYNELSASRHSRVHCRQPLLPAFQCYFKLLESSDSTIPSVAFCRAFEAMFAVIQSSKLMEFNVQLQNIIDLIMVCRKYHILCDLAVQMLLRLYDRQDTKKAYSLVFTALPDILLYENHSKETVDVIVKFLILTENAGERCELSEPYLGVLVKLPKMVQLSFLRHYLTKVKALLSLDEYRRVGFFLCKTVISTILDNGQYDQRDCKEVFTVINDLNVYVHKNDETYATQQHFLADLLPKVSNNDTLCGLLELDFYLVLSNLHRLPASLLHHQTCQKALFKHGIASRQLDDLLKSLRQHRIPCCQEALFEALLGIDQLMLRHYEQVDECRDAYWVVLLYLCGYETAQFEAKLRASGVVSDVEVERLLRFYDPLRTTTNSNADRLCLANVPNLTASQFKQFMKTAPLSNVMEMLDSAVFYELQDLQRPFEKWLLSTSDDDVIMMVLEKCPSEYLSNKTVIKLLHVNGIVRFVKRRPPVIKYILKRVSNSCYSADLLTVAARFAVKSGNVDQVDQLMAKCPNLVLQVRPVNPTLCDVILKHYTPDNHLFMPYILLIDGGFDKYPITDPYCKQRYPHLYGVALKDVKDVTVDIIRHYDPAEQVEHLTRHHEHVLPMLQDKRCRQAAVAYLRAQPKVDSVSVIDCLVQLARDVPYDDWLHNVAMQSARPSTMLSLVLHRSEHCLSPRYIVDYTRLLCDMHTTFDNDDAETWLKITTALLSKRGRVIDECLLVVLVRHLDRDRDRGMRVEEVLRRMAGRVEKERAMAMLRDDGKARLRDLLL